MEHDDDYWDEASYAELATIVALFAGLLVLMAAALLLIPVLGLGICPLVFMAGYVARVVYDMGRKSQERRNKKSKIPHSPRYNHLDAIGAMKLKPYRPPAESERALTVQEMLEEDEFGSPGLLTHKQLQSLIDASIEGKKVQARVDQIRAEMQERYERLLEESKEVNLVELPDGEEYDYYGFYRGWR